MADEIEDRPEGAADVTEEKPGLPERIGEWGAYVLLLLLVVGTVLVIVALFSGEVPTKRDPGFIDTIFASAIVVGAARIALLFACGYVVISVIALIAGRRWLRQVGPIAADEVSKSVTDVVEERDLLAADLADARDTIEVLTGQLEHASDELEQAYSHIDMLRTPGEEEPRT